MERDQNVVEIKFPPRTADHLLEILCKEELKEEIIGDLHQYYHELLRKGENWPDLKYWYHAMHFIRPFALNARLSKQNHGIMLRMNFVLAIRNILRHKFYSSINILGLAVGLTAALLIGLYITDELGYDQHFEHHDRIFRVQADLKFEDNEIILCTAPAPMAETFKAEFPEIEAAGRFRTMGEELVKVGTNFFNQDRVFLGDQALFDIFSFTSVAGRAGTALIRPNTAVINAGVAEKFFGSIPDAIGKTIEVFDKEFEVTAVTRVMPDQTHFHFDIVLSLETWKDHRNNSFWLSNNYKTYFLLKDEKDKEQLEQKFPGVLARYVGPQLEEVAGVSLDEFQRGGGRLRYTLMNVADIHLRSNTTNEIEKNGNIKYLLVFAGIGLIILLIAAINFMNLSTARSSLRSREVGMRKILGSNRRTLVYQFIFESLLFAGIAMILSVIMSYLSMPMFNHLTGKSIGDPLFAPHYLWGALITVSLVLGIMAGIYPAFVLSGFRPINVLKGQIAVRLSGKKFRDLLVITQFAGGVFLIFGSLVIIRQLNFIHHKPLGYNKEQVIILNEIQGLGSTIEAFQEELRKERQIQSVTRSDFFPTNGSRNDYPVLPKGAQKLERAVSCQVWAVDEHYIPTLKMTMAEGRNFDPNLVSDSTAIILNTAAARKLGFEDPVGEWVKIPIREDHYKVIGVVDDFHIDNFKRDIVPLVMVLNPSNSRMAVRFDGSDYTEVISIIEREWSQFNPSQPLYYEFMDRQFAAQYLAQQKLSLLFNIFSGLAIFTACLGLFGLAAFTADQRKKEIGIRKVLGAGTLRLLIGQLSQYSRLIGVAVILGIPLGHYVMEQWLADFAYRIEIGVLLYLLPAFAILLLGWLTVSIISYRSAVANPAQNLRTE